MKEVGIDISKHRSKSIEEVHGEERAREFDYVVTVCDHVKETCPFFPGEKILHKNFDDPPKYHGTDKEKLKDENCER